MKTRVLACVLLLLFVFGLVLPQVLAAAQEDELQVKARQFLDDLVREDYGAASRDFDENMLRLSGPDKLAAFWEQFKKQVGGFKRQAASRREKLEPYDIVVVTCEFEKATLDARVVFDKAKRVAGFNFTPSLPPAEYKVPAYANPDLFTEEEVTVGSAPWSLPGTITVPKGRGPFPGLVLVHGSGPNDRDETLGPNKPFKDLAWGLASRGIVVVRYEKRTRVYGPKLVAEPALVTSLTVKEEAVDDALEAARLLLRNKAVDARKVYVLGHSLGGMLIPRIAKAGETLGLAGFIIMAGLTRPLEDTFIQQMKYLFSLDGSLSDEDKKQLQGFEEQAQKVKALKESDASSTDKLFFAAPRYWLDLRGYYPPDMALTVGRPLLILQGQRDYQVTTEDFENWKKALGRRTDVTFKLYPKLNHLFFEGQGLPTPNEYTLIHGNMAEYLIKDIADWLLSL